MSRLGLEITHVKRMGAIAVLSSLVMAGACTSTLPPGPPTSTGSTQVSRAPLPNVAQVVCAGSRTVITTPTLRPQPDGVHFHVENRETTSIVFVADSLKKGSITPGQFGSIGDNLVPPGAKDMTWIVPPGSSAAACFPGPNGVKTTEETKFLSPFDVRDEDGLYVAPDLSCPLDRIKDYLRPFPVLTSTDAAIQLGSGAT